MNIFAPTPDPVLSARVLADRHVVKMPLETAQILSTILWRISPETATAISAYRPTHVNHPCVQWAGLNQFTFTWTLIHGLALCDEYTYRYDRVHKSEALLRGMMPNVGLLAAGNAEPFAQAMPIEFKGQDAHAAYRAYLADKYQKWAGAARWTRRSMPKWCAV